MKAINKFDLKEFNSYKLSARCSKALFPETEEDVVNIFKDYSLEELKILGNGNNVILSKSYYEEKFLIFNDCFNKVDVVNNIISSEAGATNKEISQIALDNGLTGFEVFYDIPSSIGGAVVMNAGSKEGEIKDVIKKVRYLDLNNMIINEIDRDEIDFDYRNSFFQRNKNTVVLKVWFDLEKGYYNDIKDKMEQIKNRRWAKQPRDYPNSGSVFKRPPGRFVGQMIDELGMKGFRVGGAKISEKHSGFIINIGNATAKDILAIISEVKKRVKEKYSLELEVEQRII